MMENKTIYEQYKQAMLNFYKRMQRDGYKGNAAYTPMIEKDNHKISIHTNSSPDKTNPQGVDFRYDSRTKELLVILGNLGHGNIDKTTGIEEVRSRLALLYHSDGTMNVTSFSEDNLLPAQKDLEGVDRENAALLVLAKDVPSISIDKLFDESDLLDELDTNYFEDLHRRFKFQAPEFDIETQKQQDIEDDEQSL